MKNIEILHYLNKAWNKLAIHQYTNPECCKFLEITKNLIKTHMQKLSKQDIQSFTIQEHQTLTYALEIISCY